VRILSILFAVAALALEGAVYPRIIVDTDLGGSSTDDLFALELVRQVEQAGRGKLIGIMLDSRDAADAKRERLLEFAKTVMHDYGWRDVPLGDESSVSLYRRLLAAAPAKSVELSAIGSARNLIGLLDSPADAVSAMAGRDLVREKVRTLRIVEGRFDGGNPESFRKIISEWPGEIVLVPFGLGRMLYLPRQLVLDHYWSEDDPIARVYRERDPDCEQGNKSQLLWDPCTVLDLLDPGMIELGEPTRGSSVRRVSIPRDRLGMVRGRLLRQGSVGCEVSAPDFRVVAISPSFICLRNVSRRAIDVSGCHLTASRQGEKLSVDYEFPPQIVLKPGEVYFLRAGEQWRGKALPMDGVNVVLWDSKWNLRQDLHFNRSWFSSAALNGCGVFFVRSEDRLAVDAADWRTAYPWEKAGPVEGEAVILSTNDSHGHLTDGKVRFSQIAEVKRALQVSGTPVALVDAGDFAARADDSIIKIMGKAGYDIATLGNHEFDYGAEKMLANVRAASFPILSATLSVTNRAAGTMSRPLPSFHMLDLGAMRVGFVGVTVPRPITNASANVSYDFIGKTDVRRWYSEVDSAIGLLTNECNSVILLAHLGLCEKPFTSKALIKNTSGLTACIDGHSHSLVSGEVVKDREGRPVTLTQAGSALKALGWMTLSSSGKVTATGHLTSLNSTNAFIFAQENRIK